MNLFSNDLFIRILLIFFIPEYFKSINFLINNYDYKKTKNKFKRWLIYLEEDFIYVRSLYLKAIGALVLLFLGIYN